MSPFCPVKFNANEQNKNIFEVIALNLMQQNVTFEQARVAYLFFLCILCDE